ncbi:MAG: efflux RND transporter periplasmic adaptor subunit [Ignavibacteriales bacterium]|nr:efflux RND transporter periplasmic adaptor subunit [Ignavibacteriales bacterium]
MKKSYYIYGSVVVVIVIGVILLFARNKSQSYNFRFDKVTQGDLTVFVTATGTINAVISVDVGTQVSGIVAKLYADFNSIVKKGQLIAQIDSTFLVQSVKDADASLDRAQAQLNDSKRSYERTSELYKKGLESELNYSAALTSYESNQAALKQAQASLDRAKINLAYATIYAPIDGVVINRAVNIGQTVAASFSSPTLFTIANDLKKMQVQTTVDESDVGRISVGQPATFTVDAYADETFSGTVSQIRLAPQSVQNVVNYIVIIDVQNDQLKLMPGMTANVKILIASAQNVMKVSNMALRFQPAADIIDTTGAGSARNSYIGRGENITDSLKSGRPSFTENNNSSEPSPTDRLRFRAIRDSIQSAHGGKLSPEDLRSEMQKMFAGKTSQRITPITSSKPKSRVSGDAAKFGIVSNYPEYQKSAYIPSHQSGRGRVWVLKSNGLLESIFVRTGLNDGRFTEINSSRLKPGDQIVLGATSNNNGTSQQVQSPLSGQSQSQGQRGPGGGGFR